MLLMSDILPHAHCVKLYNHTSGAAGGGAHMKGMRRPSCATSAAMVRSTALRASTQKALPTSRKPSCSRKFRMAPSGAPAQTDWTQPEPAFPRLWRNSIRVLSPMLFLTSLKCSPEGCEGLCIIIAPTDVSCLQQQRVLTCSSLVCVDHDPVDGAKKGLRQAGPY